MKQVEDCPHCGASSENHHWECRMVSRPVVYISGPITHGDRNRHVFNGFDAMRKLIDAGFAPINPIATACHPFAWEPGYPHSVWMEIDLPLVALSHAVLRLPGESTGATRECLYAKHLGIPVFSEIDPMVDHFGLPPGLDEGER
jgi:hypothetical protein